MTGRGVEASVFLRALSSNILKNFPARNSAFLEQTIWSPEAQIIICQLFLIVSREAFKAI